MIHISQRLETFFVVQHPILGVIYGPFGKFPSTTQGMACQKLALDLAFSICRINPRKDTWASAALGLSESVKSAIHGTQHEIYWEHLMSQ
jgi:hypothetical protein